MFVYKDFLLRDVVQRIRECMGSERAIKNLDEIENDYSEFVEG